MGDSLQKRLEEMEHERPSLSQGTETNHHKQTWKEKFAFWKRRTFGKVREILQKTSTYPKYEKEGPDLKKYYWQNEGKPLDEWMIRNRVEKEKKEQAEAETSRYVHNFLSKKHPFSQEKGEHPYFNEVLGKLVSFREAGIKNQTLGTQTQKRLVELVEPKLQEGLASVESQEHKRVSEGGEATLETYKGIGAEARRAQNEGFMPHLMEWIHTEEAQNRWVDNYLAHAPRKKVSVIRDEKGAYIIHGLPLIEGKDEWARARARERHVQRVAGNNPSFYKRHRAEIYNASPTTVYGLMKKNNPALSTSLVTQDTDPKRFFSKVGVILKEGDIYTASPQDATTVPIGKIRLPRFRAESLEKGIDEAVAQSKRNYTGREHHPQNELTVNEWTPGGFYMLNEGKPLDQNIRREMASLAISEGVPLYEFKQGSGFQEVNPRDYLSRPLQKEGSREYVSPIKGKETRKARTKKVTATLGIMILCSFFLFGSEITGKVISSEQIENVSSYVPFLFIVLLCIIFLFFLKKKKAKKELVLKAV